MNASVYGVAVEIPDTVEVTIAGEVVAIPLEAVYRRPGEPSIQLDLAPLRKLARNVYLSRRTIVSPQPLSRDEVEAMRRGMRRVKSASGPCYQRVP